MSKVIQLRPTAAARDDMEEQACLWLVRLDEGLDEAGMARLRAWLEDHPSHAGILLEMASMWDQSEVLSELSDVFPLQDYVKPASARMAWNWHYAGAFACVLALAVVLLLQFPGLSDDRASMVTVAQDEHGTLIGETRSITLPDGSEIHLNTDTRLRVSYGNSSRDIYLSHGESHFSVTKDPSRPFRVHAGLGVVEAVGTAFTVQHLAAEAVEVTVFEGEVNLSQRLPVRSPNPTGVAPNAGEQQATLSLTAGQTARLESSNDTILKRTMDASELQSKQAWRHGMLLFHGNSLEHVINEFSRYTETRFEIEDSARDIEVMGFFATDNIDGMLRTMRETFDVAVETREDGSIFLSKP